MKADWIPVTKELPPAAYASCNHSLCFLVTVSDGGDPYYGEMLSVTEAFYRFDTQQWINAGSGVIVATVTAWAWKPEPYKVPHG